MSALRHKVAQLLMVGFEGSAPSAELADYIGSLSPGSVILFARNIAPPEQLSELTASLQRASRESCGQLLIVAIDQEGGPVARLKAPYFELPGQARLGELPPGEAEEAAQKSARTIAGELRAVGINLNLAPVLDVRTRPDSAVAARCFSADPERVAALGVATICGLQEAGVAACGKHFPGHGDTSLDTHRELPTIEHDPERVWRVELSPYRAAIAAHLACVMTTHIIYRALDAARPATLSPAVVTGLLRERLGFGGLILSDDLQMGAIIRGWGLAEAAELAIRAGCDQVLVCNMLRHDDPRAVVEHLARRAAEDAELRARMEESLARIAAFKGRWAAGEAGPQPALE